MVDGDRGGEDKWASSEPDVSGLAGGSEARDDC